MLTRQRVQRPFIRCLSLMSILEVLSVYFEIVMVSGLRAKVTHIKTALGTLCVEAYGSREKKPGSNLLAGVRIPQATSRLAAQLLFS